MTLADLAPIIEKYPVDVRIELLVNLLKGDDSQRWQVAIYLWGGDDWEIHPHAEARSGDLGVAIADAVRMALERPA